MFVLRKKGRLQYLQLAWQGVSALFTTRVGGFSEEPFASLNLGLHVDDEEQTVLANRRLLGEILGSVPQPIYCRQVHGTEITVVGAGDAGRGGENFAEAIPADGLLTEERVPLVTLYADCVPLWFYDEKRRAGGVVHAGWRGTVAGIAAGALEKMEAAFGSKPGDLQVAIGPAIGPCCYRVGEEVAAAVEQIAREQGLAVADFLVSLEEAFVLDLAALNQKLLVACGVLERNLAVSGFCTCCQPSLFYSHRREGQTGRMAAIFCLQEGK